VWPVSTPAEVGYWRQDDAAAMRERLQRWATDVIGPDARVNGLERMPGHSGITWAFDVDDERLVLRMPPLGARRSAATDVHRQAPLLVALAEHGVPAPRLRWSGEHGPWFGTSYLIVDRVRGAPPGDVFAERGAPAPSAAVFAEAMRVLADIHATPPPSEWRPPTPLTAVVDHWRKLLEETPDPSWIPAGATLHARLRATVPEVGPAGLVHADYYANNWMIADGALVAVLDWEGAHRGDARVDIGWIAMMYDRASWHPDQRPDIAAAPEPEELVAAYGTPQADVAWFRALAAMRLAALTAHYLRMHRSGQRHDATWESFGVSVPYMLDRAVALLG
jgi:aminoglycoside phosphotransferase (APT) family kinase protein